MSFLPRKMECDGCGKVAEEEKYGSGFGKWGGGKLNVYPKWLKEPKDELHFCPECMMKVLAMFGLLKEEADVAPGI